MNGRLFLLSPANCGGARARQLLSPRAASPLASRLRSPEGVPLGELFAFVSALYFRGKLSYASRFARPPVVDDLVVGTGVRIITANAGLRPPTDGVRLADLEALAGIDISCDNHRFTDPLRQSAERLRDCVGPGAEVVLLGSVATPKYVDVLLAVFGRQLLFPMDFVGRGDMSRGGLLLRSVEAGAELSYVPLEGAIRHGRRPPKLPPVARRADGVRARPIGQARGTRR